MSTTTTKKADVSHPISDIITAKRKYIDSIKVALPLVIQNIRNSLTDDNPAFRLLSYTPGYMDGDPIHRFYDYGVFDAATDEFLNSDDNIIEGISEDIDVLIYAAEVIAQGDDNHIIRTIGVDMNDRKVPDNLAIIVYRDKIMVEEYDCGY